jgi:hypothetical protein
MYPGDDAFWAKVRSQGIVLSNNFFLCTAAGKVMDGYRDRFVEIWLESWNKLPEAERRPGAIKIEDRGEYRANPTFPKLPAGALVLKSYMRALDRDDKGQLSTPERLSAGKSSTVVKGEPNRDFVWITREEWKSLIPAQSKVGDTFPFPAGVRDRLACYHLVDGACFLPGVWLRREVQAVELTATVEESTPAVLRLRLRGSARMANKYGPMEFQIWGAVTYDPGKDTITRFDMAALTTERVHTDFASGKQQVVGVAFELGRPDVPGDQRMPFRIWSGDNGPKHYGLSQ